ncbi:MAG TPA: hypothetical protein PKE29_09735, partial [Phycisphaerales bacterium]|nr:hypothetical protein [Phycisphaerales bacterium]
GGGARALVVERWASLAAAGVLVGVWVLLDAVLCDLDDATSDRAHGTATLPTMVGVEPSWTITGVARLAAMGAMLACPWCPWRARVVWTVVGALGVLLLRMRRPRRVRDAGDLRLVGLAGAATVGLWAWEWLVFAGWGS